jgi:NAD(P)-dependent dehydrogenase (short-subunit alcohol dehydrogenase family)
MLHGKTIVVTGATNGIGEVTARELARAGAEVVIVSRSESKCARTAENIQSETGNQKVSYVAADLSTLDGMRHAAQTIRERFPKLHVLVNNAGALFTSRQITADGYEMTFALNHLSYFVVTNLLLDLLKATAASEGEARIVNVSSGAHYSVRGVNFDDLLRKKGYNAFGVYSETKLMNILFTNELARRLEGTGVTANSLHPGFVRTGFGMNNSGWFVRLFGLVTQFAAISPEEGAQTSIYLASSPEVRGVTGQYFTNKQIKTPSAAARDSYQQEKLWRISEELTGVHVV